MLDVKNILTILFVSLLALQPLINLRFYIDFCCFSNRKVLFLAINDAMASSPQGGATISSLMRILKRATLTLHWCLRNQASIVHRSQ